MPDEKWKTATGYELDYEARDYALIRRDGETDEGLRDRIAIIEATRPSRELQYIRPDYVNLNEDGTLTTVFRTTDPDEIAKITNGTTVDVSVGYKTPDAD